MSKHEIVSVTAIQVFTWRFHPGIETVVKTRRGVIGRAVCTAGIPIGSYKTKFCYDGGECWGGLGVENAVGATEGKTAPVLIGMDASDQYTIDQAMLGICSEAKESIGGNAIAVVSAAALKAGVEGLGISLYRHTGGTNAACLPVPGAPTATGHERYSGGVTILDPEPACPFMCHRFDSLLEASYASQGVQERRRTTMKKTGIYPPNYYDLYIIPEGHFRSGEELWALVTKTIREARYEGRISIQVDAASDCYYDRKQEKYFGPSSARPKIKEDMLKLYEHTVANYLFVITEGPFFEDDYENYAELVKCMDIQIVGDDLFTTTLSRIAYGASIGAINTMLLEVNQVGTISETLEIVQLAHRSGYGVIPCESRGEGATTADYYMGVNACAVREMVAGLVVNRFLEIERGLGSRARFSGTADLQGRRFVPYRKR